MSSSVEGVVITLHGQRFGYDEQSEEIQKYVLVSMVKNRHK